MDLHTKLLLQVGGEVWNGGGAVSIAENTVHMPFAGQPWNQLSFSKYGGIRGQQEHTELREEADIDASLRAFHADEGSYG